MTNNIYPPDHLLRKWEELIIDEEENVDVVLYKAFQAGADQELEACCAWVDANFGQEFSQNLRLLHRPKPPSLKEQALRLLSAVENSDDAAASWDFYVVRRALESLPD